MNCKKKETYRITNEREAAFKDIKKKLQNLPLLNFFNPKSGPLLLRCDASFHSIGGVLEQNRKMEVINRFISTVAS